jgi:SAM-dependent methyltransferase
MQEILPIAMPGTHSSFLKYFLTENIPTHLKILDVGAGHGAFTKKLYELGYNVNACDLFPEEFQYDKVQCDRVDITQEFPYPDNEFDIAIAIEVSEHIHDHKMFFNELNRILKPGGKLYISTPNILSLKSRFRFLSCGFFYSFTELDKNNYNGLQHIGSLTYDQYHYLAIECKFLKPIIEIDKAQSTSKWLYYLIFPFFRLIAKISKFPKAHNFRKLLLGRLLFLSFQNNK